MTDAERKLWRGLRMRQLHGYKFRRQFSLGSYIVDFVCLEASSLSVLTSTAAEFTNLKSGIDRHFIP